MARSIRIRGLEIGEGLPMICIPLWLVRRMRFSARRQR